MVNFPGLYELHVQWQLDSDGDQKSGVTQQKNAKAQTNSEREEDFQPWASREKAHCGFLLETSQV